MSRSNINSESSEARNGAQSSRGGQQNFQPNQQNVQFDQILRLLNVYLTHFFNLLVMLFERVRHALDAYFMFSEKPVDNEVVLITGSAGYLGRNIALEMAKRSAILVLVDVNEEENKKTKLELEKKGFFRVHVYTVDLTNQEAVIAASRRIKSEVGFVSVVIMAAAPTFRAKSILDTTYQDDIELHFKLGYLTQLWLMQEFVKPMVANKKGHFVTVSSASALTDIPLISSYASMKLAQTKLIETLRAELMFNGVKCVKTSVVYLCVLKGGLANGFADSYEFDNSITISGEQAAKKLVNGVLRNKDNIFVPYFPLFLIMPIKHLISPKVLDFITSIKCRINPSYLRFKQRFD